MEGFAAGAVSGCAASAILCVIISFSDAPDANALMWAAVTIGMLGAYILFRGLSAQAAACNDSELTGSAAGKSDDEDPAKRQSSLVRGPWPSSPLRPDRSQLVLRGEGNADGR
jgi:hypothetical protein